jgi:type IV pilus assembly protein PilZ
MATLLDGNEVMPLEQADLEMLIVDVQSKDQLYALYMPFIKNGGFFIGTDKNYPVGKEILLLLRLFDEKEKYPIKAKVIWLTPKFSQGKRHAGIGVQFLSDNAPEVRNKIENYLASHNSHGKFTETL